MTEYNRALLSSSTATRLSPNGTHSGLDFTIQNPNSEGYIYIGGDSSISSTNYGFRLAPNQAISFELPGKDAIYAIASTSNVYVSVIFTGLE